MSTNPEQSPNIRLVSTFVVIEMAVVLPIALQTIFRLSLHFKFKKIHILLLIASVFLLLNTVLQLYQLLFPSSDRLDVFFLIQTYSCFRGFSILITIYLLHLRQKTLGSRKRLTLCITISWFLIVIANRGMRTFFEAKAAFSGTSILSREITSPTSQIAFALVDIATFLYVLYYEYWYMTRYNRVMKRATPVSVYLEVGLICFIFAMQTALQITSAFMIVPNRLFTLGQALILARLENFVTTDVIESTVSNNEYSSKNLEANEIFISKSLIRK